MTGTGATTCGVSVRRAGGRGAVAGPGGGCGVAGAGAKVRGGHEVELFGIDAAKKRVWCYNSWGPTWGGRKNGSFYFSLKTLTRLLGEQGDATFARTA